MALPTSKTTFPTKTNGDVIEASHINSIQTSVTGIEDTVGITGSTDPTSLKYKVENTASVNPGHRHGIAGLSATGTASSTTFLRGDNTWATPTTTVDASTTVKGVSKLSVAPVTANDPIAVGNNDTRLADTSYSNKGIVRLDTSANVSGLNVTNGIISVNTGTNANQIVKLEGSGKLPAVDGSNLTNISVLKETTASNNVKFTKATEQTSLNPNGASNNWGVGTFAVFTLRNITARSNSVRLSFAFSSLQQFSGASATVSINKNGVSIATQAVTQIVANTKDVFRTYTGDITAMETGDTVSVTISAATSGGGGGNPMTVYIKDITIAYDETNSVNTLV